ncbi:MAG: hypothetical protein QM679_08185 [Patulibacter sp.]
MTTQTIPERLFTLTLTEWEAHRVMKALHADIAADARHTATQQETYGPIGAFATRDAMALCLETARVAEVCKRLADMLDAAERERDTRDGAA